VVAALESLIADDSAGDFPFVLTVFPPLSKGSDPFGKSTKVITRLEARRRRRGLP
jgi:hypothetical protein